MDERKRSEADNVINLKDRKKNKKNRQLRNSVQAKRGRHKGNGPIKGKYSLWQYIQLIILLGLGAYLMHMCRG